jgi:hypothetical protein
MFWSEDSEDRHDRAGTNARRLADEQRLADIGHRMDYAVEYIRAASVGCGVSAETAAQLAEKLEKNLLSKWAKDLLYGCCECLPPDGAEDFLEVRFGVKL